MPHITLTDVQRLIQPLSGWLLKADYDIYIVENPHLSVLQATELLHLIINEHDDQSSL